MNKDIYKIVLCIVLILIVIQMAKFLNQYTPIEGFSLDFMYAPNIPALENNIDQQKYKTKFYLKNSNDNLWNSVSPKMQLVNNNLNCEQ